MATVVVPATPPRDGLVLPALSESGGLTPGDATALYTGLLRDAVAAAAASGGDLLVNYRPDDLLPGEFRRDEDAETAVRAAVAPALPEVDDVRFEPQVGSTRSARVGNAVTHLLREEGVSGVIVADPRAPMLGRTGIDEIAMKLRRSEVVLAPSTRGRVAALAASELLDFEDALAPPSLNTVTDRALATDLAVDFRSVEPFVETPGDLASLLAIVRARGAAERRRPEFTAATADELALDVEGADGGVRVAARTDSS